MDAPLREVAVGSGLTAGGRRPLFIAGPCVIESEAHVRAVALQLASWARDKGWQLVFKASFDKANRTALSSYRGPGLDEGLRILAEVKRESGLPILTDIHEPAQAERAAEVADVLQIPAFLCRQTDLLLAAARTGRCVNVKKGQFLAPDDMAHVVDMRAIPAMRSLGFPVIFDATHSVQLPGAGAGKSSGQREYISTLARAAAAAGADGFFFEVHDNPEAALSDGPNALPLAEVPAMVETLTAFHALARKSGPGRK